jgi:hypothetical protein
MKKYNKEVMKRYYKNHKEDKLNYSNAYYYSKKYEKENYIYDKEIILEKKNITLTFD